MDLEEKPDLGKLFENIPEHPEPYKAEIIGEIPDWVEGTLLRNGPGIFKIGNDEYNHLFDGLAVIQRHHVKNGQVEYSTKFLRSETYKRNMRAQRIVVSEFGTMAFPDPCKTIFHRYFSYFYPLSDNTDNDLVHFVQCGDEIYASSETGRLNRIDPNTLDTIDNVDMSQYIAVNTATAHPHYDAQENGYNMGSRFGKNGTYNIIFVPKPANSGGNAFEKCKIIASIPAKSSYLSYYHSFGMSENYIIFPEMPLLMNPWRILTSGFTRKPFSDAIEWWPDLGATFHFVNLHTGENPPISFTADSFFIFHHINAYEEGSCIFMDAVVYEDGSVINSLSIEQIRNGQFPMEHENKRGLLRRFVFPMEIPCNCSEGDDILAKLRVPTKAKAVLKKDGSVHCAPETLFQQGFELPRINYDYNGKKYKYCYGTATSHRGDDYMGAQVFKFDLDKRQVLQWTRDHDYQFASEPVFVAGPGSTEEDDGVLLVPVTNLKEGEKNFLLVLDAKTMKELARANIEPHLPIGFHGIYLPSTD